MKNYFKIRQEIPSDYEEVCVLVKVSFATNSGDDGTTHEYLNENRKIIGQIVLYKMLIKTENKNITELLLSPIFVHPEYFRKGIARSLINESFKIAIKKGYKAVYLCGDPKIYRKFGFKPTFEYKIFHISDLDKNAEWCMVFELVKDTLNGIMGTVNIV